MILLKRAKEPTTPEKKKDKQSLTLSENGTESGGSQKAIRTGFSFPRGKVSRCAPTAKAVDEGYGNAGNE